MRILFDTNVILDVLLARKPYLRHSVWVFDQAAEGVIQGLLGATTVTTIYYLSARSNGRQRAGEQVDGLLRRFDVAAVDRAVLTEAAKGEFPDYEDSVLYHAARKADADGIVTRNEKDFSQADMTVYRPEELRAALE